MCSVYSLLCELGLVLVCDTNVFKALELLGFDALNLTLFIQKTLTDFFTFFQVIETVLLNVLFVITDLSPDGVSVVLKVHFLLLIDLALLGLGTFVLFNHADESITLKFGLLTKHLFSLFELLLAGNV